MLTRDDEIRFWAYVRKTDTCWLWQGGRTGAGYGHFAPRRGFQRLAHRLAYTLARGAIPAGQFVLHTCDTPACVRPEHLFLGTQADNMLDKTRKNRQARGEHNGNAKLTWAQVRAMRAELAAGATPTQMARTYRVHRDLVYMIRSGKLWKEEEN